MRVYEGKIRARVFAYVQIEAEDEQDFYKKVDELDAAGHVDYEYEDEPDVEILDFTEIKR